MTKEPVRMKFPGFSTEVFSEGKNPLCPDENEDVVKVHHQGMMVAVIDGAKSKRLAPGMTAEQASGRNLAKLIGSLLLYADKSLVGDALVKHISLMVALQFSKQVLMEVWEKHPEARPSASMAVASILQDELVVTQVGDVAFRVNGVDVYTNPRELDFVHADKRVQVIRQAIALNPLRPIADLLPLGRAAIQESLLEQVAKYQNKTTAPYGHGVIDGQPVPEVFIKTYRFPLAEVKMLEIFTDGYFQIAKEPTIVSWEEAAADVEHEDPYKIGKYPSTKGSEPGCHADDRTVLIVRFG